MKNIVAALLLLALSTPVLAQHGHTHAMGRAIEFPDVDGFLSLTCDFHMHSVFSDGDVWPTIRVQEALRDNLDCIAITEHLEYQPHLADIPHPDRNRAFDLASRAASNSELIVIPGTEITRSLPFGHANSIFIQDANPMLTDDAEDAYAEAQNQGGFTFMNHPNWTSQRMDGVARMEEMNIALVEKQQIQGIEVVNDLTYSDEALEIALEHNLAIIGTSDIHGLVDWQYDIPGGGHRPVTIVLAKDRSIEGIKEALLERRTIAWYLDTFVGREEHVMPLIDATLNIESAAYTGNSSILRVVLTNSSESEYTLLNTSGYRFHNHADLLMVPPHHSLEVLVKTGERLETVDLSFDVLNVITAPDTHPNVTLRVPLDG